MNFIFKEMLKLSKECISNQISENYEKNYSITVNGEDFGFCRFLADLLSPKN